jgi:hypothetical protein
VREPLRCRQSVKEAYYSIQLKSTTSYKYTNSNTVNNTGSFQKSNKSTLPTQFRLSLRTSLPPTFNFTAQRRRPARFRPPRSRCPAQSHHPLPKVAIHCPKSPATTFFGVFVHCPTSRSAPSSQDVFMHQILEPRG